MDAIRRLRAFFERRVDHPFPSDMEKHALASECNLHFKQISDWYEAAATAQSE